jgi:hypothetical protein
VVLVGLLALVPVLAIGVIEVRTRAGIPELEEEFASYTPPRIAELGSTKKRASACGECRRERNCAHRGVWASDDSEVVETVR